MSNIKNIIFDLGGVLIDWNPRYLYNTIFDTPAETEKFLSNVCTMDWNEQQDAGRSLQAATDLLVTQHPSKKTEIEAYYGRWEEMLGGPIEGTVKILEELKSKANQRLLALTNWSAETFPIAQERYDFLDHFEHIVVSGTEKCVKPNQKIYKKLMKKTKINPEESLFIDDNIRNCIAAERSGIKCIHFNSPEQLSASLMKMNLL